MDNRRLLLAVFLSWIVVIGWGLLFSPKAPENLPEAPAAVEDSTTSSQPPDSSTTPPRESPPPGAPGNGAPAPQEDASEGLEAAPEADPISAEVERTTRIETESFVAELTNRGAQLSSFRLKDQLDSSGEPLDLVRARNGKPLPFALVDLGGEPLEINEALYAFKKSEGPAGERELVFEYRGNLGAATKRFSFRGNGRVRFEVEYAGSPNWAVFFGPGVSNPSAEKIAQAQFWRGAAYRNGSGKIKRVDARKAKERKELVVGEARWAALDDQYFMTAFIPKEGVTTIALVPYWVDGPEGDGGAPTAVPPLDDLSKEQRNRPRSLALLLQARSERVVVDSFWGAKIYSELVQQSDGLEGAIDYGWFSFLARPLQWALNQLYMHVVPNYGWAIILLTIAIKLVLLPLTHKSMTSAQKMQVLNPKVQAIRTRYRSKLKDAKGRPNLEMQRKMQDEIMTLYKAEGVNPAGGCLPMLVQIPVFFAFYQLLRAAIELRNAPWIGWIQDLSSMDPHYVLPLVMFGTQFIQQLRMPMGTDPMQRRLFLLMPFMFLFIFLKFPSGLVLYWLTNNVFSILQQEVYLRRKKRVEAGQLIHPTPKKKRSSKA